MIRTIITPQQEEMLISVPREYVGKKLELTLLAVDEINREAPKTTEPPVTMAQFWGILSKETGDAILKAAEASRNEWDRNF